MFIPSGNWIIVRRHIRDTHTRGEIMRGGMSEAVARIKSAQYRLPSHDVWVMRMEDY